MSMGSREGNLSVMYITTSYRLCSRADKSLAQHKTCNLFVTHILFLLDVSNYVNFTMVYWFIAWFRRILCHASCKVFKVIISLFSFINCSQIVTRALLNKPSYTDNVNQTPYFAGIIFGSIIWVVFCWVTRLINREHNLCFFCAF